MNKAILSGVLVAHIGSSKTDAGVDVHQATLKTFEPYLKGSGREEFHPLVFFYEDAKRAAELPIGSKVLVQAAVRWIPAPGLHVHGLEVL